MNTITLEIKTKLTGKVAIVKEVKVFEQCIDAKLPTEYVQFLLQYNGGRAKKDCCELIEAIEVVEKIFSVSWLYTLSDNYDYNLLKNYLIFKNRIPKELISIGVDGCSNQICLAVRGDNYGKLYFWDHNWENDDEEQEPDYSNVYLIANSFTEFVNKLYEYKLEDEDR